MNILRQANILLCTNNQIRKGIIISVMANVRSEAERVRKLFLHDLEMATGDACRPGLFMRIGTFLSSFERDLYVQAGSLKITHSFLLSFYGVTASYIAVLASAF